MKRYGNYVTSEDLSEEVSGEQKQDRVTVMFGGCGYGAGTFNKARVMKIPCRDFWSLLGLRRQKVEETG